MNEIKCPKCDYIFKEKDSGFAEILKQARDHEFEKALDERVRTMQKDKENAVELAEAQTREASQKESAKKDAAIAELKTKLELIGSRKDSETKIALSQIEKERDELKASLETVKCEKEAAIKLAESETKNSLQEELATRNTEISELKAQIEAAKNEKESAVTIVKATVEKDMAALKAELRAKEDAATLAKTEKQLAVTEAVSKIEKERDALAGELKAKDNEQQLLEASLKDKHAAELKTKDEMIAYYKDMKAKLSTKMVGETLEQHCEDSFNKIRATAFPNAYFEKDSDIADGTKGDYIYCENDENGSEIISIMFEMKNENDTTATKHKNEEFLTKLDKDRKSKHCEYAVLVRRAN